MDIHPNFYLQLLTTESRRCRPKAILKTSGKKKKILLTRIPPGLLKSIYFYKISEKFKSTRKLQENLTST